MRVGLIGTGNWATLVHGPSVARHPNVTFIGMWGRDSARTAELATGLGIRAYTELEALFGDVDALTFAVPPDVQADIAVRAARRGCHLLLEKPIATSVAEASRLERAVTDARVASLVFFTLRFIPEAQAWLQRVTELGGWRSGRAEMALNSFGQGGPSAVSPWRREKGALWDLGPHALSLLWPVLGEVHSVVAGAGLGDQVHLIMRHMHGQSSTTSLTLTAPEAATGRTVYVDGDSGRNTAPLGALEIPDMVAAHAKALDALIDSVERADRVHPCDVHFGARVVEVLAAAQQSLATGRRVEVGRDTMPREV